MQSPVTVFDHTRREVTTVAIGPGADRRLAEVIESQREQVATSGRPAKWDGNRR